MQRYFSNKLVDDKLILNDDDIHHIKNVMRMKDNDYIEVVYNNKLYKCIVNNVNDAIEIKLDSELVYSEDMLPQITLIIPLLKDKKMDLIVQKATELGVNEIMPVIMERSIIKLDNEKFLKKRERLTRICKEASEQSKRIDIPYIHELKTIKELENIDGLRIVCSTSDNIKSIKMYLKNKSEYGKLNVVIGPEGGLSSKEEHMLVDLGFDRVSLGNRIMRVETVPMYILSVLNYEYME